MPSEEHKELVALLRERLSKPKDQLSSDEQQERAELVKIMQDSLSQGLTLEAESDNDSD